MARRLLAALSAPLSLRGAQVTVSASIGLAHAHVTGGDPHHIVEELLHAADAAMYQAKAAGKSRIHTHHTPGPTTPDQAPCIPAAHDGAGPGAAGIAQSR